MTAAVLDLHRLNVTIETPFGDARVLRDLDLSLLPGERLGIVGESGSGKSMTALAIMGLLPEAARTEGRINYRQEALLDADEKRLCEIRGRRIAMIFQEPMSALNPVQPIGDQIAEGPRLHLAMGRSKAISRAKSLLDMVGLPPHTFSPSLYPHQLSGGQRQRVMIAIALASEPELLIADEPTTALDVSIQADILDLIATLATEKAMGVMVISHDLGVIARATSRLAVMYAGSIVEEGPTTMLLEKMAHPYTRGLLAAMPQRVLQHDQPARRRPRLKTIPGTVPDPLQPITGCAFAGRCRFVQSNCRDATPGLAALSADHRVACFHPVTTETALEVIN